MEDQREKFYKVIAKNLVMYRKQRGLSQDGLASMCRTDRGKISKIENATETFVLDTAIDICIALNITMEDLVRGS